MLLIVIKKDQTRQQYDRSKLEAGLMRACYKRAIPVEKLNQLLDSVEGELYRISDREVHSTQIGELVLKRLKDLDAVAYVRFASVYRSFCDINTFMEELKTLLGRHNE